MLSTENMFINRPEIKESKEEYKWEYKIKNIWIDETKTTEIKSLVLKEMHEAAYESSHQTIWYKHASDVIADINPLVSYSYTSTYTSYLTSNNIQNSFWQIYAG